MRYPEWTRLENLALYLVIEQNATLLKRNDELAERAFKTFPDILSKRSISGISQHISKLKDQSNELNIPDPVHNKDIEFNNY